MAKVTQKTAIYFLLIIAGLFVLFKFYWTQEVTRWLAFGGFILSSYFLIKLIKELINLLYPSTADINVSILFSKEKFQNFKRQNGDAGKKTSMFLLIVTATFAIGISAWSNFIKNYELNQLTQFGQTQKVIISDIHKLGRGTKYSFFNVYFKNKIATRHLYQKSGQDIGDTSLIIFSTDNTDIIKWADDFGNIK